MSLQVVARSVNRLLPRLPRSACRTLAISCEGPRAQARACRAHPDRHGLTAREAKDLVSFIALFGSALPPRMFALANDTRPDLRQLREFVGSLCQATLYEACQPNTLNLCE